MMLKNVQRIRELLSSDGARLLVSKQTGYSRVLANGIHSVDGRTVRGLIERGELVLESDVKLSRCYRLKGDD